MPRQTPKRAMRADWERTARSLNLTRKQAETIRRFGNRCYGHGYSDALEHTAREVRELVDFLREKDDE